MRKEERQNLILDCLRKSDVPLSGATLSKNMQVSRQIIVQDINRLRDRGMDIISTNKGYILNEIPVFERVIKVIHGEEETVKELQTIVDLGGSVQDVFVYHKAYGVIRADLEIRTRQDIDTFLKSIRSGKSTLLMNVTSGYHYHTIRAKSGEQLDEIQKQLSALGFLAKLQDYEPVDFKKKAE